MVFIIPGIDSAAPERTLTSSGSDASPNFLPVCASTCLSAASTWGFTASGRVLFAA